MKRAYLFVIVLLAAAAAQADSFTGKVTRVHDGDTITVERAPATRSNPALEENVRLNTIDAPELAQPKGKEAGEYLRKLLLGQHVRVDFDERDRYARVIGQVTLTGKSKERPDGTVTLTAEVPVNERMLRTGWAWHYREYDKQARLQALEDAAHEKHVGLWKDPNPVAPWDFRKAKRKAQAAAKAGKPPEGVLVLPR